MERVKPQMINVGKSSASKRLYELERLRAELIKKCAKEWNKIAAKHFGFDPEENIWVRGMPQALFDTLESFEQPSSQLAAQAYLEHYGFTVIPPEGEGKEG